MIKKIVSRQVRLNQDRWRTLAHHIIFPEQSNYQKGFIPLLITLMIILAAIVWLAYKHVASVQK